MTTNLRSRSGGMRVALLAGVVFATSAVQATPITYNFTVSATSGRLAGLSSTGTFSFDSSAVVPAGQVSSLSALTSFDFTFYKYNYDPVDYGLAKLKTSILEFDAAGQLTSFQFSTLCPGCAWGFPSTNWKMAPGVGGFDYSVSPPRGVSAIQRGKGDVAFAVVAVPEPGTLGLFGLGALMIGFGVVSRRRRIS